MSTLDDLAQALASPEPPEAELLPYVPPEALPAVTLKDGNPGRIMQACRVVAKRAGFSLVQWDEFAASFYSCARGAPEEQAKLMDVVRSHFEVTTTATFRDDPMLWDFRHAVPFEPD